MFSEHFLEHIDYPRSAKHFAREAHRVLSPGGQLVTGVPDAGYVLNQYPAGPERATQMIALLAVATRRLVQLRREVTTLRRSVATAVRKGGR